MGQTQGPPRDQSVWGALGLSVFIIFFMEMMDPQDDRGIKYSDSLFYESENTRHVSARRAGFPRGCSCICPEIWHCLFQFLSKLEPHIGVSQHPGIRAQLVSAASPTSGTRCTGQRAPRRAGRLEAALRVPLLIRTFSRNRTQCPAVLSRSRNE